MDSSLIGFWMCIAPFAVLMIWLTFRSIVRWKSRQYFVSSVPYPTGASIYAALCNPIRRSLGIRPLRVIPYLDHDHRHEMELLERADRLAREIRAALKHNPMSPARKASLERQAREAPDNLVKVLWTLVRLRRIQDSIEPRYDQDGHNRREVTAMQNKLLGEMARSVEVLSSIPVSLMKVELARSDGAVDGLLASLGETNQRLIDLSTSYTEIKAMSVYGLG